MSEDEALDEAQYHEYLNSLLIEFLKKNNDLLRKKLLEEFERGAPLTGKNTAFVKSSLHLTWSFLAEHIFPTTSESESHLSFMRNWITFGNMEL